MFFSEETVINAINILSKIQYDYVGKNGNPDLLSFFLILKRIGISEKKWISKDELYNNKNLTLLSIYELGGLFDDNEDASYKGCLFFSSFCKKEDLNETSFFNQKTKFNSLPGRLKDTIDNSIADYILDKGMADSYRLKGNYLSVLRQNYKQKINLDALIIWIYRHTEIDGLLLSQLRKVFFYNYNLDENEMREVFDFSSRISIKYAKECIKAAKLRKYLNADKFTEVSKAPSINQYGFNLNIKNTENILIKMNINKEKILSLLEKNKQIILTGAPGTGKSFIIQELSKKYHEIKKIQFHQNYTYQQFILGKTIEDGNVKTKKGELLLFLERVDKVRDKQFLLFIDEINRGNISSIFGEALYALDRGNEINLEDKFKLIFPDNLHIIGTMNSADRSIAIIDFAIRRRFAFVELKPDYNIIDQNAKINNKQILGSFLQKINKNIVPKSCNSLIKIYK